MRALPLGLGGAPSGATKRVRGVPNRMRRRHVNPAAGALGGALYGATKRVRTTNRPLFNLSLLFLALSLLFLSFSIGVIRNQKEIIRTHQEILRKP